jgi:hypothetical protein
VALAALIMASEEADGEDAELRATLPLLGHTLVEQQVRQAVGAGAGHVVLLVERLPAGSRSMSRVPSMRPPTASTPTSGCWCSPTAALPTSRCSMPCSRCPRRH